MSLMLLDAIVRVCALPAAVESRALVVSDLVVEMAVVPDPLVWAVPSEVPLAALLAALVQKYVQQVEL